MVKKGNRGSRDPVAVESLQLEQIRVSRVTLLEAYLEAWQQPSHVCGVIRDKIREQYVRVQGIWAGEGNAVDPLPDADGEAFSQRPVKVPGLREQHRNLPDYQVWDRSFQRYLQKHQLAQEWLRIWHIPLFSGYGVSEQLQTLMKWVEGWQQLSQILVLGYDPGMLAWLPQLARRVRGIHFYLDYEPREMEEIQDWIYEEYGLVTKWQVLESGEAAEAEPETAAKMAGRQEEKASEPFGGGAQAEPRTSGRQERKTSEPFAGGAQAEPGITGRQERKTSESFVGGEQEALEASGQLTGAVPVRKRQAYPGLSQYLRSYQVPCLVIDLTGLPDIPVTGLKPGSMWWDLGAMEEKRHLLEDRPLGVQYFSLQTLWRDMPGIVTGT